MFVKWQKYPVFLQWSSRNTHNCWGTASDGSLQLGVFWPGLSRERDMTYVELLSLYVQIRTYLWFAKTWNGNI